MSQYTTVELLMDALDLHTPDDPVLVRHLGELIVRTSGRMDRVIGFSFGGDTVTRTLDGQGESRLFLPPPGAISVTSVIENGVTLTPADYEIEPVLLRYLLRLDPQGHETLWSLVSRGIIVTYTPTPAPDDLEQLCLVECVRSYQGQAAGYPDVVGVDGANQVRIKRSFADGTYEALCQIGAQFGVRNLVAV